MYDIPNYQIGQFHCFHFIGSKLTNINCACFRYTMSCFGMHIHCEITTTTLLTYIHYLGKAFIVFNFVRRE